MKIIGTNPGGFILTATADEIANLLGQYGEHSLDRDKRPAVGMEIDPRPLMEHRREFQGIERTLAQAAAQLRGASAILDGLPEVIKPAPPKAPLPPAGETF